MLCAVPMFTVVEHLFGPLEFSRRDLIAINIQRARDHGLPDYNSVREAYGLRRLTSWDEINTYNVSEESESEPEFSNTTLYPDGLYMKGVHIVKICRLETRLIIQCM